jgi:hypothetical protein
MCTVKEQYILKDKQVKKTILKQFSFAVGGTDLPSHGPRKPGPESRKTFRT